MKIVEKIINIILIACVSVLLLFNIVTLVGSKVFHNPLPHFLGFATIRINDGAGSMLPTLEPGDVLLIKRKNAYAKGDVITFKDESVAGYTTHRIVEENADGSFTTKGDGNGSNDPTPVTKDLIEGKLVFKSGILRFIQTPLGILTILALGFVFIEAPRFLGKRNNKEKQDA